MTEPISTLSMIDLFRVEVDTQARVLTSGLLALERDPRDASELEQCMRAAHSLKGAARIVGIDSGVRVAHVLEDCFVAAQQGRAVLHQARIDLLLRGVDWLTKLAKDPEAERERVAAYVSTLQHELERGDAEPAEAASAIASPSFAGARSTPGGSAGSIAEPVAEPVTAESDATVSGDRVLRVGAENLNRLLGLASESLVESRRLQPLVDSLLRLRRMQRESAKLIEAVGAAASERGDDTARAAADEAQRRIDDCQRFLAERLVELEAFARRSTDVSRRLYDEALDSRMRPFSDGLRAFPRMVRDLGRQLGKQVKLVIHGHATQIDRDILEKLDAPLTHLLQNAVDHGIESPEERSAAGKPAQATIHLEARHSAGRLEISIVDDGRGIAVDRVRARVVERKMAAAETAARLSDAELLEFLFLPGFTLKDDVNAISGRGVGLDIVHHMVQQVRGTVRVDTTLGQRTRFQLQLPLTLSVVRALLVEIAGEPYALPLAYVERILKLDAQRIEQLEGRQHFHLDGRNIALATAHQVLDVERTESAGELPVVVIGGADHPYGMIVDRLLGERELVIQPLDPRLGKIKDVTAGALMEDGTPVLILDVEDMVRSIEKLAVEGALDRARNGDVADRKRRKRVLIVDDSLTVRELERKLLAGRGYDVDVAVDGMDGWNAVRVGKFDLVVTDVDMPRLDGIELVHMIKRDPALRALPVLIVSYKDREEDRVRGLDAGADYYLTKGSFHDERLLEAVTDLIGEASA